jgi:shikimate kinase/3-dehydroquinate synthase
MSDGIVLVGLPGSGKSTVGRRVAELLRKPFLDLDEMVTRMTGRTPADLITRDGEYALRAVDRRAVDEATQVTGAVIATGGGSVLDPLNRWRLMEHGVRIRLDAPVEVLARRLVNDTVTRPLLGTDIEAGLGRAAASREAVYLAADHAVDSAADVDAVAQQVIEASLGIPLDEIWRTLYDGQFARHHTLGPERGRIVMGAGLEGPYLRLALETFGGQQPAAVADRRAIAAHPSLVDAIGRSRVCELDGGEAAKDFRHLEELLAWLSDIGAERLDPLVVIGGGTIGDLGGLAAALHQRGMPLVSVPTTWLAQADSAVGGKVAINLPGAKNGVGAFWPAWLTISDVHMFESLPAERRRDGIAECLKCGLIGDPELWDLVETRGAAAVAGRDPAAAYAMTERAARLKLAIVDEDPHERGRRRELNLGHTLGHALEIESGYALAHGDAVALGLRAVGAIAETRGAEPGLGDRIDTVLESIGFPLRRAFDRSVVVASLRSDKKRRQGVLRWILPIAVGRLEEVDDVTPRELELALDRIAA